ncbi:MAG: hypothetical protein JSU91_01490 [Thermoplasmatales archaeon]|nr:MAG: hypothetical protein JSU91_01490 [Thermoplasmatales archaeon]
MKLKYFSMLFSIIGILVLYMISKFSQAPVITISDIQNYEGKQVTLRGIVTEHHLTKFGSQIIKIADNNSSVEIFLEGKTDVEYGDEIQATGEVQNYKDIWELIVNDIRQLQILKKWQNISFPLWQIAENPTRYLNINVNITGYIESVSNAYFLLVDIERKHSLIIYYSISKNITLYPGQKICASGKFTFDEKNFRYMLDICEENHGIAIAKTE